jgi:hypothetical protein
MCEGQEAPHSVGLRGNFVANSKNVGSPEEPEKMCVKRDPAPRGKLCDSVVPNGLDKVSAARHVIYYHREIRGDRPSVAT